MFRSSLSGRNSFLSITRHFVPGYFSFYRRNPARNLERPFPTALFLGGSAEHQIESCCLRYWEFRLCARFAVQRFVCRDIGSRFFVGKSGRVRYLV